MSPQLSDLRDQHLHRYRLPRIVLVGLPLWELDGRPLYFRVWKLPQQVIDAVEARAAQH